MTVDYLSSINQSGSGLNITQIVDSLVEAEKSPQEDQIQSKIDAKTTSISAIGEIKSALSSLSTSLNRLTGNTSLKVNSTGDKRKGRHPKIATINHAKVENKNVCLRLSFNSFSKFASINKTPINIVINAPETKA